jgi:uncharacterized protein (DUF3084 family)
MNERLQKLKHQTSEHQTITLELVSHLKTRIVELEARLKKMNQMKEKLLKIENRIIDQNETIADAAAYANVEVFETFNRIKTIKNRVNKMN